MTLCEVFSRLSLCHLNHILKRVQDLLIVGFLALRRHLLDLDPAHTVERDRLLELLRGELFALGVLRDD